MFARIIIGLVTVVLSFNFVCLSKDFKFSGTASEMYIKGFQEHFNSLSSKEQSKIVSDINDLGRKFEVIMDSADFYIGLRNDRIASLRKYPAVSTDDKQALNLSLIHI